MVGIKDQSVFVLKHQGGDIKYTFEQGGYAIQNSKLYLSIRTIAVDDKAFPNCYLLAVDGQPIDAPLVSTTIKMANNLNNTLPNVYVYTTFHAREIAAEIQLSLRPESEIEVAINIITEDVNYYNDKAKPNAFIGSVKLNKKDISELWMPA